MNRYGYSVIVHGVKKNVKPFFFSPSFRKWNLFKSIDVFYETREELESTFYSEVSREKKKKIEYVPEE